jgi:hypothetical protein
MLKKMLSQPKRAVIELSWNWGCAWQFWWQNLKSGSAWKCTVKYSAIYIFIYINI